jgi:hypothetical protein
MAMCAPWMHGSIHDVPCRPRADTHCRMNVWPPSNLPSPRALLAHPSSPLIPVMALPNANPEPLALLLSAVLVALLLGFWLSDPLGLTLTTSNRVWPWSSGASSGRGMGRYWCCSIVHWSMRVSAGSLGLELTDECPMAMAFDCRIRQLAVTECTREPLAYTWVKGQCTALQPVKAQNCSYARPHDKEF